MNDADEFAVVLPADLWATVHGALAVDAKQILSNLDRIAPSDIADAVTHAERLRAAAQAIDHYGRAHYAEQ